MNVACSTGLCLLLAACGSGHYATVEPGHAAFVVPHHIAEGDGEGQDPAPAASKPGPVEGVGPAHGAEGASGGANSAAPGVPREAASLGAPSGSAPDPEPLMLAEQWEYQLLFQNGAPSVESVTHRALPKPVATPRRMGRFALELWIGRELIDRVRFDFPLVAADERPGVTRRPLHDPPSLGARAVSRIRVSVPASPRATRLVLVDRASAKAQELPWPPAATAP